MRYVVTREGSDEATKGTRCGTGEGYDMVYQAGVEEFAQTPWPLVVRITYDAQPAVHNPHNREKCDRYPRYILV